MNKIKLNIWHGFTGIVIENVKHTRVSLRTMTNAKLVKI